MAEQGARPRSFLRFAEECALAVSATLACDRVFLRLAEEEGVHRSSARVVPVGQEVCSFPPRRGGRGCSSARVVPVGQEVCSFPPHWGGKSPSRAPARGVSSASRRGVPPRRAWRWPAAAFSSASRRKRAFSRPRGNGCTGSLLVSSALGRQRAGQGARSRSFLRFAEGRAWDGGGVTLACGRVFLRPAEEKAGPPRRWPARSSSLRS
jgi:hypothetical protein